MPGGARRCGTADDKNPHAHRQRQRDRCRQGPGYGRQRLHHQALFHTRIGAKSRRAAGAPIRSASMKKIDPRLLWAVALAGLVMAAWLVLVGVVVWSTLETG